jgi:hypothetical protein
MRSSGRLPFRVRARHVRLDPAQPISLSLPPLVSSLLLGDVLCIALVMVAGEERRLAAHSPFPQLAASGWLPRGQRSFTRRSQVILLGLTSGACSKAASPRAAVPDRSHRPGYFATIGIAVALGRYTKASEDLAAQRGIDAQPRTSEPPDHSDMQDSVLG